MLLFHAEDLIQPEFPGAALHEKAIGIEQEDGRKDGDDADTQVEQRDKRLFVRDPVIGGQKD